MAHRKLGYKFDNDQSLEVMKKNLDEHYAKMVTVPVNVEIKADHRVLSYDSVKQYLINASKISLLDCECRTNRRNCDAPVQVCIGINGKAEHILKTKDDLESWRARI
jgi:hypothetical protein